MPRFIDIDGAVTAAAAADARKALGPQVFDARDYGVIADGAEHNNVANLLDCFAACAAVGGGTVLLPAGVIVTSEADLGSVTADSGNTYANGGGIPLPEDTPITVQGHGVGATVLKLSPGFTRGFDFRFVAEGQTFRDITIRGVTVDRDTLRASDIAPLTTITGPVTLTSGVYTAVPGLSPAAFKNADFVYFPPANTGTARNLVAPATIDAGQVLVKVDGGDRTLADGDQVQAAIWGHIIAGTHTRGYLNPGTGMTIRNVLIEDCEAINIYTDLPGEGVNSPDLVCGSIGFRMQRGTSAGSSLTNMTCRRVRAYGGMTGFEIKGTNSPWLDNIWFEDCYHDTTIDPPSYFVGAINFMVGQYAHVGRVGLVRCIGRRSWDVGVEIDQAWEAYEIDCRWEDCANAVYRTSFVPPAKTQDGPLTTTLNNGGTLSSGATTCTVTGLPAGADREGLARISWNPDVFATNASSELVWYQATNDAGTAWTIWRGINGTTAASHADGAAITFVQADKTRFYSIRSSVNNQTALTTGWGISWSSYTNHGLPLPPLTVRDANVTLVGGQLFPGQVVRQNGWCPEVDIDGLRVTHSGLANTASATYGFGAVYLYSANTAAMRTAGVPCPPPRVTGRNNAITVTGSSATAETYNAVAQVGGWHSYDLEIALHASIRGAAGKVGFNALQGYIQPGSRLGIAVSNPATENSPTRAFNAGGSVTIGATLALDVDASGINFTPNSTDSNYVPWVFDPKHINNLAITNVKHSALAAGSYPEVKRATTLVTSSMSPYSVTSRDEVLLVDTSSGAVTINLPPSTGGGTTVEPLTRGRTLQIIDAKATAGINPITITPVAADKIDSGAAGASRVIASAAGSVTLAASSTLPGWIGTANSVANLPASATPEVSRLVCTTSVGSGGTEDGANTWAKIATITLSASRDFACVLQCVGGYIASESAVVAVSVRSSTAGNPPTVTVDMTSKSGSTTRIAPNSFKAISDVANGSGVTTVELWMLKTGTYSRFSFYEIAKTGYDLAANPIVYNDGAAWQSATPTGASVNVASSGVTAFGLPLGMKVAVPASAGATGSPGSWAADASYFYVCTAVNTWKRTAIATWP